jgi:dolichol kinase
MFEIKRKLIHWLGLSVPLLYWFTSKTATLWFVGLAVVCGIFIEATRLKSEKFNQFIFKIIGEYARTHEQKKITGATYYAVAAFLTVGFFSKKVAISSLLFLTLGDSVAALVGTRFGSHAVFGKSIEGSLACLFVCAVVGWLLLGWVGLIGAVAATVIELVPIPIDDNLRIPLVSGILMQGIKLLCE